MPTRDDLVAVFNPAPGQAPVHWTVAAAPVPYPEAVRHMEDRASAIADGRAPEQVWLLEHPPLYTAGTSARVADLDPTRLPVFQTGRGGQYTYHGPGQRVAYVMLDLKRRNPDLRAYVAALEDWIVATLARFNLRARRGGNSGSASGGTARQAPALDGSPAEDKIAAIGIRVRRWVSFHGISINVEPDLSHFGGIVPCGIADAHLGVTSLVDLGYPVTMADVDAAMRTSFEAIFGPTVAG